MTNAFSRGGIPLKVHAVANVKLPSEESLLHNAIERFGASRKASGRQRHARRQPARCHRRAYARGNQPAEDDLSAKLIGKLTRICIGWASARQPANPKTSAMTSATCRRWVGFVRRASKSADCRAASVGIGGGAKAHNQMNAEISKIDTDTQVAQRKPASHRGSADQSAGGDFGSAQSQAADGNQGAQLRAWEARPSRCGANSKPM